MHFHGVTSLHTFSFSQVANALAVIHRVSERRLAAFQSRLKHFQRHGFPAATKTGRGVAAAYRVEDAIKLALALELNQMGLTPERALLVLRENLYRAKIGFALAIRPERDGSTFPMFLSFDPNGLADLTDGADDQTDETFNYAGLGQLIENITTWSGNGMRRLALINLTMLVVGLTTELAVTADASRMDLIEEAGAWAATDSDVDQNPDPYGDD